MATFRFWKKKKSIFFPDSLPTYWDFESGGQIKSFSWGGELVYNTCTPCVLKNTYLYYPYLDFSWSEYRVSQLQLLIRE